MTTIVTLSTGVRVFNSSAHGYIMEDGTEVPGNPDVSKLLVSKFEEQVVSSANGVEFVQSVPVPTAEGVAWLARFKAENPGVLVVTSFANLTAYADEALVGFIATEETARVKDLADKRMRLNKMAVVPANQFSVPREAINAALKSLGFDFLTKGTEKARHAVQEPGQLLADANTDSSWGRYVKSIVDLLAAAKMTEYDFLALLLADQPFGAMPPKGSRESDQALEIRWQYAGMDDVRINVPGEVQLFIAGGYDRDGRSLESALSLDEMDGPTAEKTLRRIATLRQEPVWVIWKRMGEGVVAIEPQA